MEYNRSMNSSSNTISTAGTTPPSPKQKLDFSSGPRPLTQQEIESLQKSNQEASEANQAYFRELLGIK
jgi:hypothetical protein